jgi:hypothetical protein
LVSEPGSFRKQFNHWKEIMDYSENGVPMFNGQNGFKYEIWSRRTEVFLQAQGHYIWLSVVTGYDSSKREKTATKKELKKNNKIAMDFIWEGLPKPVREKVGKCSSAKELWDKLHDIYSSPIADSENAKEDADTEQEERCSSCQTDSEEEECDEAEVDYKEKLISAIKYLRKEREENKSSKKELMKQKQSVQGSEKDQQVIKNLRAQLEEARRIEETLEYQKKCLEANIEAQKEDAERRENILMDHLKERTNDLNQLEEEFGQEERRMEEEIIALKIQLEEEKRTEEVMKSQIMKKEEEVENLEEEVVTLRVKINKLNKKVEETETSISVVENEEKHSTLLEKKNEKRKDVRYRKVWKIIERKEGRVNKEQVQEIVPSDIVVKDESTDRKKEVRAQRDNKSTNEDDDEYKSEQELF